jgi:hypothetical protein
MYILIIEGEILTLRCKTAYSMAAPTPAYLTCNYFYKGKKKTEKPCYDFISQNQSQTLCLSQNVQE